MNKIFTVAILGVGSRGGDAYGVLIHEKKDQFKIVALCDLRQEKLDCFGEKFEVKKENLFLNEEKFFEKKRADLLVIATQDKDHVRHALKAFALGYDILLEKPVTANREELTSLIKAQEESGCKALVCHVLRYSPAFQKAKEILQSGTLGKLVALNALERVVFWHQAHSYVRGNWRNAEESTPMILAKCCHDLDLIVDYVGCECESVSSVGDLTYFKSENAPEGATARCVDCPHSGSCPYDARYIYIERWKKGGAPQNVWPYNVLCLAPVTEEKLQTAIEEGQYGRCVFACDNTAVDHQLVQMNFKNGVKAALTMTAFTHSSGRRINFYCTEGELLLDEGEILVKKYGKEVQTINTANLIEGGHAHGGGDAMLVEQLYETLLGNAPQATSLKVSAESHYIGICAEESRKQGGTLIKVHE